MLSEKSFFSTLLPRERVSYITAIGKYLPNELRRILQSELFADNIILRVNVSDENTIGITLLKQFNKEYSLDNVLFTEGDIHWGPMYYLDEHFISAPR